MLDSVQVVNAALEHIASQTRITSLSQTTGAGAGAAQAANVVYAPTVQLMLREIQPDFASATDVLTLIVTGAPVVPWAFKYAYPTTCVRLRQVRPPAAGPSAADPFDPKPVLAAVSFDLSTSPAAKVIVTNQASALAVYTTSAITEASWDSAFADAVIRRLANPLAMALSGRPDFAEKILMQSAQMAQTAEAIDEGAFRLG